MLCHLRRRPTQRSSTTPICPAGGDGTGRWLCRSSWQYARVWLRRCFAPSTPPRFSQELGLFHDLEESVALCAEADATTLQDAGYEFRWLLRTPVFYRAVLSAEGQKLKIEWAQDSAFRFFPVHKDDRCGYRLHHADAALNKVLALAGRHEIRDFVDILHLHDN